MIRLRYRERRARACIAAPPSRRGLADRDPGFSLNRLLRLGPDDGDLAAQGGGLRRPTTSSYAGGVESMSRCPMGSDMGPLPPSLTERYNLVPQGLSAEMIGGALEPEPHRARRVRAREPAPRLAGDPGRAGSRRASSPSRTRSADGRETVAGRTSTRARRRRSTAGRRSSPPFLPNGRSTPGNSSASSTGRAASSSPPSAREGPGSSRRARGLLDRSSSAPSR